MKGQALVESLFTYILIFLVSFAVIEVARLQSFKALLQISVNYYAKYLALNEMRLIKSGEFRLDSKSVQSSTLIENEIKSALSNDLSFMGTSLFSFDEGTLKLLKHNVFVSVDMLSQQTSNSPSGIHIKAQTCLPVMFVSFFESFANASSTHIGRSINDNARERNCLGEFLSRNSAEKNESGKSPRFWFRVRAAGYSPWPSSTQIFYHGIAIPKKIKLIDSKQRKKLLKKLDEVLNDQNISF